MNTKNRHWTFIVYPDSVEENWIQILIETGLPFAISPLHDKDINQDGLETKKPHYHVVVTYDGPTTYKSVNENICQVIKSTIPKRVLSLRGIYRYLTHEDNPEKYHYNREDIHEYNNFHIDMTDTEINYQMVQITNDIVNHDLRSFYDLINYYLNISDFDNFKIVSNHVYYFSKYIDSYKSSILKFN